MSEPIQPTGAPAPAAGAPSQPQDAPKDQQLQKADPPPARPPREVRVVVSDIMLLDTAKFEQMQRIAAAMAESSIIPDHLVAQPWWWRKNMAPAELTGMRTQLGNEEWNRSWADARKRTVANCFLVVEQSFRWGMSPFAVAPETYVIGGKLAYQGKLILAVVNVLAGLEDRLEYEWTGEKGKDSRAIVIRGTFPGGKVREDGINVGDAKTDNMMWKKDPDQKLLYSGAIHWARRWCPEVVLGVMTLEDVERIEEEERQRGPLRLGSTLDAFAQGGEIGTGGAAGAVIEVEHRPDPVSLEAGAAIPQEAAAASLGEAAKEVSEPSPGAGGDGQLPLGGDPLDESATRRRR